MSAVSSTTDELKIEISLSPFATSWDEMLDAAIAADELGVSGIWIMDHLSGKVNGVEKVLECFTVLGGLGTILRNARLGSLVVNAGLRPPAVLAQSAATLHEQCGGRFVLGLGAGGGSGTPYEQEMEAAGIGDSPAAIRRERVEDTVTIVERLWSGEVESWKGEQFHVGSAEGYLHPKTPPKVMIAGFGPKMAAMAGRRASLFNTSANHPKLARLVDVAQSAAIEANRPELEISVFDQFMPDWLDPSSDARKRIAHAGVDTLMLVVTAPFDAAVLKDIAAASS